MLRKANTLAVLTSNPPIEASETKGSTKPPEGEGDQVKGNTTLTYTIVLPLLRRDIN